MPKEPGSGASSSHAQRQHKARASWRFNSGQLESLPGGELTLKATEETTGNKRKLSVPSLIAQSHRVQFTEYKAELKLA